LNFFGKRKFKMKPNEYLYTEIPIHKINLKPKNWDLCRVFKNADQIVIVNKSNNHKVTFYSFECIERNHKNMFHLVFFKELEPFMDQFLCLKGYMNYDNQQNLEISEIQFGKNSKVIFEKNKENEIAKIFIGFEKDFQIFHDKLLKK